MERANHAQCDRKNAVYVIKTCGDLFSQNLLNYSKNFSFENVLIYSTVNDLLSFTRKPSYIQE